MDVSEQLVATWGVDSAGLVVGDWREIVALPPWLLAPSCPDAVVIRVLVGTLDVVDTVAI